MFSKYVLLLCFALMLISESVSATEDVHCYNSSSEDIHGNFATKTAYEKIKGTLADSTDAGCKPEKIWMLIRHGASYPAESEQKDFLNLKELRDTIVQLSPLSLCEDDKALLGSWEWDANKTDHPEALANEGWEEMKTLAVDYKAVFGDDLFDSTENVLFRHTTEQRNNESIYGFATTLFGLNNYRGNTTDNDILFKFYEKCDKWLENEDKLNDVNSDLSKFERSATFNKTIGEISDRLGSSTNLSLEQIINIWDMCRFDRAWNNDKPSPWCSAFTPDHVTVLEYREDIKLYYKTGQGEEINSRLACKAVTDLIAHLESDATTSPKAIVSVADATTIQLLLTALGTHNDTLTPSIEMVNMDKRKWKSSEMSPYASNLAAVKYNCTDKDQVKLFLNQKVLVWCEGDCTLSKFVEKYQQFKEVDCQEYAECSEKSWSAKIGHEVLAIIVSLILIYLH